MTLTNLQPGASGTFCARENVLMTTFQLDPPYSIFNSPGPYQIMDTTSNCIQSGDPFYCPTPTPTPTPTMTPTLTPTSVCLDISLGFSTVDCKGASGACIAPLTDWGYSGTLQIGSIIYTKDCIDPAQDGFYSVGGTCYEVSGGFGEITNISAC